MSQISLYDNYLLSGASVPATTHNEPSPLSFPGSESSLLFYSYWNCLGFICIIWRKLRIVTDVSQSHSVTFFYIPRYFIYPEMKLLQIGHFWKRGDFGFIWIMAQIWNWGDFVFWKRTNFGRPGSRIWPVTKTGQIRKS